MTSGLRKFFLRLLDIFIIIILKWRSCPMPYYFIYIQQIGIKLILLWVNRFISFIINNFFNEFNSCINCCILDYFLCFILFNLIRVFHIIYLILLFSFTQLLIINHIGITLLFLIELFLNLLTNSLSPLIYLLFNLFIPQLIFWYTSNL